MKNLKKVNVLLPSLFLMILSVSSCDKSNFGIKGEGDIVTQEISLPDFNSVKISNSADLFFLKGDVQKVEISAQQNIIDNITKEVNNREWKISNDKNVKSHKDIKIYITVPEVKSIVLSGSGNITTDDKFIGDKIDFKISGSGDINFIVETDRVNTSISGSGNVNLNGETTEQEVIISGSGSYNSYSLNSEKCEITISGSGNCETTVKNQLFVTISGSGDVYYKGYPSINSVITGSGSIFDAN